MNIQQYFKRKSIEQLTFEAGRGYGLERTLGAFQLIMLGIGAIVGAGIFVYVGIAAGQHAGPATMLSFALAGVACICTAFCYAELASAIPISGSSYTFTYAAFGELPAFVVGGVICLAYCLNTAAIASGWSAYLQSFLFDYGIQFPAICTKNFGNTVTLADGTIITTLLDLPAVIITFLTCSIVFCGTKLSSIVNAIIVVIKTTVLLIFIIIGITKINPVNWQPFIPANTGNFGEFGLSGIIAGAGVILLAYTGFDVIATAAQETKNPQRNLPIGIVGSLLICIFFYIAVSAVLTGLVPYTELNVVDPIAKAVDKLDIPWFAHVIKIGAIIGLASVVLAFIYASVRILFSITHDGLLPKNIAKIHPQHHTPYIATIIVGIVTGIFAGFLPVDILVKGANLGILSTFVVVCVATIYLRYTQPALKREFKCPWIPGIPLLSIIIFLIIIFSFPKIIFLMTLCWLAILLVVYFGYSHKNCIINCK